ncbi:MAG: hypothetical protein ABI171_01465 [Collimonas sp.]|uniref:hypothetical protein n=1 Tax=Collimonas sp. TaxID=1963772 RepID=UPI003264ACB4
MDLLAGRLAGDNKPHCRMHLQHRIRPEQQKLRADIASAQGGRKFYETQREKMRADFDFIVTEVSVNNPRSLRAHQQVGFREIAHGGVDAVEWCVVAWDWS